MPIYTRTGDKGQTGLFGGERVPKNHSRVAAYGAIDELNSALGVARAAIVANPKLRALDVAAARVQAECFMIGALLATPADKAGKLASPFDNGLPPAAVTRLEREIDAWDAELQPLKNFILPGGGPAGAALHVARAVARRAERETVALDAEDAAPTGVLIYLNRLSTWLFVAARHANQVVGSAETVWTGLKEVR